MKAYIIEDEPLVARDLLNLLRRLAPDIEVVAQATSVVEAHQLLTTSPQPDLLFMDIQLADGQSFELLRNTTIECPVIFTTAYNNFALQAFQLNSVDYLLKPIDEEDLIAALAKFRKYFHHELPVPALQGLLQTLSAPPSAYRERLMAVHKGAVVPLPVSQIGCIIKEEIIYLNTIDGRRLLSEYDTMEEVEKMLNPAQFFRANRQHIIAIEAIEHFQPGFNGKLIVRMKAPAGYLVDVSRDKATEFKSWLGA